MKLDKIAAPIHPQLSKLWVLAFVLATLLAGAGIFLQWNQLSPATAKHLLLSVQGMYIALGLAVCGLLASAYCRAVAAWALLAVTGWVGALLLVRVYEHTQVLEVAHVGMSSLYEVNLLLLFCMGALALRLFAHTYARYLIVGVLFLQALMAGFNVWLVWEGQAVPRELVPALQNLILPFHVIANFIGYGAFMVAAVASAVVLWTVRRGQQDLAKQADVIAYRAISIGFPVFTLAVLLGCIWAYQAWGGYWSWDPKETWALIVWLIYAGYLHQRLRHTTKIKVLAWWSIVGFLATLFCYLGVNMFLSGLHSYGGLGV
jgi:cytochrome c-type biogenesis protein CcsB